MYFIGLVVTLIICAIVSVLTYSVGLKTNRIPSYDTGTYKFMFISISLIISALWFVFIPLIIAFYVITITWKKIWNRFIEERFERYTDKLAETLKNNQK